MQKLRFVMLGACTAMTLMLPSRADNVTGSASPQGDEPAPVMDSVKQETQDREEQISKSAPAETEVQSGMPVGGTVLSGSKQKKSAALDSSKIVTGQSRKTIPATSADGRPTVAIALGGPGGGRDSVARADVG